tara:strand:- start:766 stop:1215 length:450 start_codon:yes stop_codon:yes gene_type:complete
MKYSNSIEINLSREKVIELFDNAENLKRWQPDLISYEFLEGEPGAEGSTMNMVFKRTKNKTMTLKETIEKNNFPEEMVSTYETKGVFNIQKNRFIANGPQQTTWVSDSEFQFSTLGMKIIGFLMPGAFKKQSCKYMEQFKAFAEEESKK